jgi:purine-binding chemotaxis protein CheW
MIDDDTRKAIQQVVASDDKEKKAVERKQIVVFELDKEEYASAIDDLREIIKMRTITPIPGSPAFIAGIVNVRGQIVVVIDLEKRFMLKRDNAFSPLHIIIVEVEGNVFGIIVDEVTGVLRVPVDSIKATPAMITSKISSDYVKGVIVLEEGESAPDSTIEAENKGEKQADQTNQARLLLLLDIPRMLSEKELQQFSKIIQDTSKEKPAAEPPSSSVSSKAQVLKPKPDDFKSNLSDGQKKSSLETNDYAKSEEVNTPTDRNAWQSANQSPLA